MFDEKSCGAVVYYRKHDDFRYVVIQQRHGRHFGFPKGHMEGRETEAMTAYREVKEETGLDVLVIPNVKAETTYSPRFGVKKQVVYFLAEAKSMTSERHDDEILHVLWLNEEETLKKLTHQNDRDIFSLLVGHLKDERSL